MARKDDGARNRIKKMRASVCVRRRWANVRRREDTFTAMLRVMERREANGSPPDVAAATIVRALTAPRPRAVYLCGKDSRRLAVLSGLPAPVLDLARRRIFRLPAPGSLAS